MVDEMTAFHDNSTWELVSLPVGKSPWVYTRKTGPDGKVEHLKARLVAKGFAQVFVEDYTDTFSPVGKMSSVRLFFALTAMHS